MKQDYQKLLVNATGYEQWIESPAAGELSVKAVFGKQRSQENSLLLTENWTGSKSHESCSVPTLHHRTELVSTRFKENEKLKRFKNPFPILKVASSIYLLCSMCLNTYSRSLTPEQCNWKPFNSGGLHIIQWSQRYLTWCKKVPATKWKTPLISYFTSFLSSTWTNDNCLIINYHHLAVDVN